VLFLFSALNYLFIYLNSPFIHHIIIFLFITNLYSPVFPSIFNLLSTFVPQSPIIYYFQLLNPHILYAILLFVLLNSSFILLNIHSINSFFSQDHHNVSYNPILLIILSNLNLRIMFTACLIFIYFSHHHSNLYKVLKVSFFFIIKLYFSEK
jgi:hypothetical protein